MKIYVDGSYMKRLKNISISYCIIDNNKKILDEFGLSVGYGDYSEYIDKYGHKFVGLLAMCKTIDRLYKNREIYNKDNIEIYIQNPFVVYAMRIMNSSNGIINFIGQWAELYPFLEFIRKRIKYINIKVIQKSQDNSGLDRDNISLNEVQGNQVFGIVMPPLGMRCTS
ncbi:MAG: hypothetical protein RR840_04525 [Clostridium sp.]